MGTELCCNCQDWPDTSVAEIKETFPVYSRSNSAARKSFNVPQLKLGKKNEPGESLPNYVRVLTVTDPNGRRKRLYIPAALDLERPKRPRTTFTERQLHVLERQFEDNHFISEARRQTLAMELGLTETQIKVWFQNRRTKCRRLGECHASVSHSPPHFSIAGTGPVSEDKFMLPMTPAGLHLPLLPLQPTPNLFPPPTWSPHLAGFVTTAPRTTSVTPTTATTITATTARNVLWTGGNPPKSIP